MLNPGRLCCPLFPDTCCIRTHIHIQQLSCRRKHRILILHSPLNRGIHMSTPESINRIPGLNRIARSKNIGKNLISMGNNRIGIHTMKMILDIRQRQHAHSHRIHNHILCSLNIEQSDIHCIINKTRLHRQPASD